MPVRNSLAGALPQLLAAEAALRSRATALGIEYRIADFGGVRTQADTVLIMGYRAADYAAAVARNPDVARIPINEWRPIASFGSSMHNYGAAFDVKIVRAPAGMSESAALQRLKTLAPSVGLRSNIPNDPPHFELPISLSQARAMWGKAPGIVDATTASVATGAVLVAILLALSIARRRR